MELRPGQEVPLVDADGRPVRQLRMGLSWDHARGAGAMGTGAPEIDLDATALQFSAGRLFDLAFYNNLHTRDGSVEHLGDHRSGRGEGDDETVLVDLDRVHGPVDVVLLLVSSYQGHALEWIANAACRVTDATGTELARVTLTQGPPETGVVMATLHRGEPHWTLRAVGAGVAITVPTERLGRLQPFVTG